MRKILIFTVMAFLSTVGLKIAKAEEINVNKTFTTDTIFNPFSPPPESVIYSFKISGSIEMNSASGLARVIFVTDKGEYMLIESYPLISSDSVFEFSDYCDETCYLDGVTPVEIRLEINNATIYIHHFYFDFEEVEDAATKQYLAKKEADHVKVDLMNFNISELGMDWFAGETSLVDLFYKDKKEMYGENYNLLGYDYYTGGIYQVIGQIYEPVTDFSLVNHWDWRDRHGANNLASPYFDNDSTNFTGWLTVSKNQSAPVSECEACGAFGTIGVLESIVNLYYNQHLDLDLSEQHLLACVPGASCSSVPVDIALGFIIDSGVVDESCSPYRAVDHEGDCEVDTIVCNDPDIVAKITDSTHFQGSLTSGWEDICEEMVLNGPIGLTINDGHHHVTLIGWVYNQQNEQLAIIFKDSYGTGIGDHGFVTQQVSGNYRDAASQHVPYFAEIPVQPTVQVYDADGDGYCWWGIGPKPFGCDSCDDRRDCDDNNPFKHQYNADYSCYCYDPFTSYDSIKITTDTTWQGSVRLDKPLIIEAGGQLTITGTVFVPWTMSTYPIIVKKGGKLIIDGGKITKACDELWRGIQVWGDSSLSQYPYSNQGYLSMINGGCIEYAKTAVLVGRKLSDTVYRYAYSGGIVTCENAIFLNNEVDVEFLPFINDHPSSAGNEIENFSGFRTTKFHMYDPEFVLPKPIAHVILDEVNGVEFYGCEFMTEEVPNFPIEEDDRGIGILAYDAQVLVKGKCISGTTPCTSYDSCYFGHLRYGIKASNLGKNKYFSVSESVLDSNIAGIYISGYHEPVIISSYFNIYLGIEIIPLLEEQFFGGVYLHGSTGYLIENNHFDGLWPSGWEMPPLRISKIGIYIKDSGEENNEIYNNLFTGVHAGIVAEGVNKGANTGLCLRCNDFRACMNDIIVTPGLFAERERYIGINQNQGTDTTTSSTLAGNTFTPEIQNMTAFDNDGNYKCYWSYFNEADYINYYHHPNNPPFMLYPSEGNFTSLTISLINKGTSYDKSIACPSSLNNNHLKSLEDTRAEIANANLHIGTLLNDYYAMVDGGSTESMNFEIATSMPDEALDLRQELLSGSPYLSDSVMKNAILKENVLPNAMIRDILTANPQSAKSFDLLETVDNRIDPMPDYMMAEIMQAKEQLGAKESMESEISYWEQYRARAVRQLIREYLTDSAMINRNDSLIQLFENETNLESKYRLAFTYWDAGQTGQALMTLNAIPAEFGLSSSQVLAYEAYFEFFDILQTMKDSSLHASQLDSATVQQLITIMDENLQGVSACARGLLLKGRHIEFMETVSFPTEVKSFPDYQDYKKPEFSEEETLHLFPNPAGDYVVAYFNTIELGEKGRIVINDIQGKIIENLPLRSEQNQQVIDLSAYPNGIYLINLYVDDKLIATQKLSKGLK